MVEFSWHNFANAVAEKMSWSLYELHSTGPTHEEGSTLNDTTDSRAFFEFLEADEENVSDHMQHVNQT